VFPSKPLVKKAYLPKKLQTIDSLYTKYYKKSLGSESKNVLYPLQSLQNVEKTMSTFWTLDTHNSIYGYLTIVNDLLVNVGMDPIDRNKYSISEQKISGDLCKKLGTSNKVPEHKLFFTIENSTKIYNNIKYLPGNTNNMAVYINSKARIKKRLLVFGDSFFVGAINNILHLLFREILYIRSPFIHPDIIDRFKPDIVLTGNAERYLSNVENDHNANDILLELYGDEKYTPDDMYIKVLKAQLAYGFYRSKYNLWKNEFALMYENEATDLDSAIENLVHYFKRINKPQMAAIILQHKDLLSTSKPVRQLKAADILRDLALSFEKENKINAAKLLMQEAFALRPNGSIIKAKLEAYKRF